MSVKIYTHPDFLKHEMGQHHPECPERLDTILSALKRQFSTDQVTLFEPPQATREQLARVHDRAYVDSICDMAPASGYAQLDPDTSMNPFTLSAALHASGALIAAVEDVAQGHAQRVFCAVRPPGHHAEPDAAMGFCFFNNIAVGVAHALAQGYFQKVAIVDFDVHHGNGTESMFLHEPRVCFWSSFQHPFYPGTYLSGKPSHIHLCPLAAGTTGGEFRQKVTQQLIPILEDFKPECIFISAGFDAHRLDPLANLQFETQDYEFVTQALIKVADKYSGGRVISTLEGGYHLKALPESVVAHVKGMMG